MSRDAQPLNLLTNLSMKTNLFPHRHVLCSHSDSVHQILEPQQGRQFIQL